MICDLLLLLVCFLLFILLISIETYEPVHSEVNPIIMRALQTEPTISKEKPELKISKEDPINVKPRCEVIGFMASPKAGAPIGDFATILKNEPYIVYK